MIQVLTLQQTPADHLISIAPSVRTPVDLGTSAAEDAQGLQNVQKARRGSPEDYAQKLPTTSMQRDNRSSRVPSGAIARVSSCASGGASRSAASHTKCGKSWLETRMVQQESSRVAKLMKR